MNLFVLILAVFVLTLLLTAGVSYWLLGGAGEKKKIMTRLQAIQEASTRDDSESLRLLKKELEDEIPMIQRWVGTLPGIPEVRLFLEQAGATTEAETFIGISLSLALAVLAILLVVGSPTVLAVVVAIAAGAAPAIVFLVKRHKRFRRFEELFPDAIDQLARAVRAGHAFTSGFELIGEELPDPVGKEFRTTYNQQNLGIPLQVALQNLATRMPLPDVRFFVAAVTIQRESGGNLGEVLDSLARVVRERFKLFRQIQIYTAEGRMSMVVLMAMPFVAAGSMYLLDPDYMLPLFTDPKGQTALIVAAIMQVIGFFVIRKMIQIKV